MELGREMGGGGVIIRVKYAADIIIFWDRRREDWRETKKALLGLGDSQLKAPLHHGLFTIPVPVSDVAWMCEKLIYLCTIQRLETKV